MRRETVALFHPYSSFNRFIQTLLSRAFTLPTPTLPLVYHAALICELCRISPTTFGPAVGKCFRKLHDMVGEGLDVEISRRYAEWFAIHLSNFEFRWPPWQEWYGRCSKIIPAKSSPGLRTSAFLLRTHESNLFAEFWTRKYD